METKKVLAGLFIVGVFLVGAGIGSAIAISGSNNADAVEIVKLVPVFISEDLEEQEIESPVINPVQEQEPETKRVWWVSSGGVDVDEEEPEQVELDQEEEEQEEPELEEQEQVDPADIKASVPGEEMGVERW